MNKVSVLDCTLRDGGYINRFNFGKNSISKIISNLVDSKIEIIECGFLKKNADDPDKTLFSSIEQINKYLPLKVNHECMFVAMIAYGDISIENISQFIGHGVSGIRLTFHQHEMDYAVEFAKELIKKGYKVFIQPVGTNTYTDSMLLNLLDKTNRLNPYAFYLVDTLGNMYEKDLLRLFYMVDNNLNKDILTGFHSHNNLQLSFSNAQTLISIHSKRKIIIDASVFGMGRGAGNLCTELITQFINENIENKYNLIPLMETIDEYIMQIYFKQSWGYSTPYYIAATNNCHPNYASYLMNLQTLCIKDINTIIKSIPTEKRHLFDKEIISELYLKYQANNIDDSEAIKQIHELCHNKKILILAPGKSLLTYRDKIDNFIENENPIVFSINHIPKFHRYDKVFVGNIKRLKGMDDVIQQIKDKLICTSNISNKKDICTINYSDYLNSDDDYIFDNSGLMLINIMKKIGIKELALAGFDGFNIENAKTYFDENFSNNEDAQRRKEKNISMINYFANAKKAMKIIFITPTIYDGGEQIE